MIKAAMADTPTLKHVLVADDSPTIHKAVRLTLPEHEFQVAMAHTGKEALDLLKGQDFDLVLADVNMPELSGYDLAQAIKVRLGKVDLPVILMCGTFDRFDQDRFIWCKANHRIWKPFETTSFLEIVRQYLQISKKQPVAPKSVVATEPESVVTTKEVRVERPTLREELVVRPPVVPVSEVVTETPNKGFQVEKEVRKWLASDAGKALLRELVKREVQEVLAKLERDLIDQLQKDPIDADVSPKVSMIQPF